MMPLVPSFLYPVHSAHSLYIGPRSCFNRFNAMQLKRNKNFIVTNEKLRIHCTECTRAHIRYTWAHKNTHSMYRHVRLNTRRSPCTKCTLYTHRDHTTCSRFYIIRINCYKYIVSSEHTIDTNLNQIDENGLVCVCFTSKFHSPHTHTRTFEHTHTQSVSCALLLRMCYVE